MDSGAPDNVHLTASECNGQTCSRSWAPPATTRRAVFPLAARSRETSCPTNGFLHGPPTAHGSSSAISRSRLAEEVLYLDRPDAVTGGNVGLQLPVALAVAALLGFESFEVNIPNEALKGRYAFRQAFEKGHYLVLRIKDNSAVVEKPNIHLEPQEMLKTVAQSGRPVSVEWKDDGSLAVRLGHCEVQGRGCEPDALWTPA